MKHTQSTLYTKPKNSRVYLSKQPQIITIKTPRTFASKHIFKASILRSPRINSYQYSMQHPVSYDIKSNDNLSTFDAIQLPSPNGLQIEKNDNKSQYIQYISNKLNDKLFLQKSQKRQREREGLLSDTSETSDSETDYLTGSVAFQ